ncbi:hypothetical protein HanRHA438_Chr10g0448271 [Helianthus annuus]|uniref:uncharacterized protein LOC110884869 n=1 Tax=Helianthus annuus TaxID=4232 RepID=UPI000B9036A4|nr:uncharacterized protein LOC110884869 [Helianthus annuus]KAJ0513521.1 hypothetical protein HanHA300_Chr10g0358551 [Helianthus annuus]KAJ0529630.1 hypothetical protein HanHA89_Chr10g0380091 [Helianthus annuus]KAJ0699961.1 hypothetical protein HanOQP8_Chr10g0362081 [Helianthus annuus]KAJ0742802.1 hypothetical protein HanPI659440_Chr10g0368341 [Helianthus annuus]KAJ0879175.1 hypothetical protein HanRHA438_Chr10g0448271 [Helianthus annuus]
MRPNQKNMVIRIITTPFRAIRKAKDFYIRSITDCANHTNYGVAAASLGNPMSRNSSTSSFGSSNAAAEDLRELIRANSTTRNDLDITRADLELYIKQHVATAKGSRRVPRSVSVGMGRIDEEAPVSSFGDDADLGRKVKSDHLMFPRSRSHAVTNSDHKFTRFSF